MHEGKAVATIIRLATSAPEGRLQLVNAQEFLIGGLEKNRFNTERAIEIYTFAIDRSVLAWVKEMPSGKSMFPTYWRTGLGKQYAIDLTEKFKTKVDSPLGPIQDQRPPRRFLRFLLGA